MGKKGGEENFNDIYSAVTHRKKRKAREGGTGIASGVKRSSVRAEKEKKKKARAEKQVKEDSACHEEG